MARKSRYIRYIEAVKKSVKREPVKKAPSAVTDKKKN